MTDFFCFQITVFCKGNIDMRVFGELEVTEDLAHSSWGRGAQLPNQNFPNFVPRQELANC